MKLLETAHSCLSDILDKRIPFKLAIENTTKKNTLFPEDRKRLSNTVGCTLRHYYLFMNILERAGLTLEPSQRNAMFLYLANRLFLDNVSSSEFKTFLKDQNIRDTDIKKINSLSLDKDSLIPTEYAKDSIEFLNLRYNTPKWVLRIWMKHFKGYSYKIVKANNKPGNHFALVHTPLTTKEKLLSEYREIEDSEFEHLVVYKGNVPPSKHSLFKSTQLILCSPAEDYVLSKLDLDIYRDVVIYAEYKNKLHLQLMSYISANMKLYYIAGDSEPYYQMKKDIDTFKLFKTQLFEAKSSSIITCLPHKVPTLFLLPKNTNFAEFRNTPDYFNRVEQSSLDGMLANQTASLEEASKFIEDNGHLVYMVPTMNKKETVNIILDFLAHHHEFTLVEQRQFLPFDKYDSTFYFAILRKEPEND